MPDRISFFSLKQMFEEQIFMVLKLQSVIQRQAKHANMGNQLRVLESAMNSMLISL